VDEEGSKELLTSAQAAETSSSSSGGDDRRSRFLKAVVSHARPTLENCLRNRWAEEIMYLREAAFPG